MPLKVAIIILLTIFTIGSLWYAVYIILHRILHRRYVRERYAFAALGVTITLIILALSSLSVAPPWTIIAGLLSHIFNDPSLALPQPNWAEKALVVGFVAFALWLLHRNSINCVMTNLFLHDQRQDYNYF
jgi:hypothetical protein